MSSKSTINLPHLQGSTNYTIWKVRASAYLIKEGYLDVISEEPSNTSNTMRSKKALAEIQLLCEDGPLIQIKNADTAYKAWTTLKWLYNPTGFSSEFLLTKEFFNSTLDRYSSIEEYLNKVKELDNELNSRNLKLPEPIVIAWVLYNLDESYEGFISHITQEL